MCACVNMCIGNVRRFEHNKIKCIHCGEVSHASRDCPSKGKPGEVIQAMMKSKQSDAEYDAFLTELETGKAAERSTYMHAYMHAQPNCLRHADGQCTCGQGTAHVCIHVDVHACVYLCMDVYTHVDVHVCTHVDMHVYTHVHAQATGNRGC